ncbi:MAG TPA: RnfABCDGE type electron transport complex subunit B [Treponemataceae bacterium]|nr:RnfABCDGE type electron transport complex subunit B [Treponemataceae bacterium]
MNTLLLTLIVSLGLASLLGFLLGVFKKVFHVDVDPLVSAVREALPGANCGACGYPGCDGLAQAIAAGDAAPTACTVGGAPVASAIGALMGVSAEAETKAVVLFCQGSLEHCKPKAEYVGIKTCQAAKLSVNGTKLCDWGCIGFGDCEKACPFDAIHVAEDGIPHVDYTKCTGCGICTGACPQKILSLVPVARRGAVALCSNRNTRKAQVIKDCKVGCIKCGKCEKVCPKSCIKVTNGIPVVDYSVCDSCGECVKNCPTKVLSLVEISCAKE